MSRSAPNIRAQTNEKSIAILKTKYISPEKRYQFIDESTLVQYKTSMEYQKIITFLDNKTNQLSKYRTENGYR